jgi:hypothetical protein
MSGKKFVCKLRASAAAAVKNNGSVRVCRSGLDNMYRPKRELIARSLFLCHRSYQIGTNVLEFSDGVICRVWGGVQE